MIFLLIAQLLMIQFQFRLKFWIAGFNVNMTIRDSYVRRQNLVQIYVFVYFWTLKNPVLAKYSAPNSLISIPIAFLDS